MIGTQGENFNRVCDTLWNSWWILQSVDTVGRCTTSYLLAGPACLWYLVWCSTMYGDRAGYPTVDFGGWKRGVGPNCMENEEYFLPWVMLTLILNGIVNWKASISPIMLVFQPRIMQCMTLSGGETKAPQVVFPHVLNIHKWGQTKPCVIRLRIPKWRLAMASGGQSCQYYKDLVS